MKIFLLILATVFYQKVLCQNQECEIKAQAVRDAYDKFIEDHGHDSQENSENLKSLKEKCRDFTSDKCNLSHTIFPKKAPIQEACLQFEAGV